MPSVPMRVCQGDALLTSWGCGGRSGHLFEGLDMAGSSTDRCFGRMQALKNVVAVALSASMMTACASDSYQEAAMQAFDSGDRKAAISLGKKEVARLSGPDQC